MKRLILFLALIFHIIYHNQIAELKRGAEIIVCTPGRMIDMLAANSGIITDNDVAQPSVQLEFSHCRVKIET